jgi:hypothetical protein
MGERVYKGDVTFIYNLSFFIKSQQSLTEYMYVRQCHKGNIILYEPV